MCCSCVYLSLSLQNSPLYIRTFDEEEDLGFHYIAHVSLDIMEEKLRSAGTMTAKDDMYLGFLGPIEDYRACVYRSSCVWINRSICFANAVCHLSIYAATATSPTHPSSS